MPKNHENKYETTTFNLGYKLDTQKQKYNRHGSFSRHINLELFSHVLTSRNVC